MLPPAMAETEAAALAALWARPPPALRRVLLLQPTPSLDDDAAQSLRLELTWVAAALAAVCDGTGVAVTTAALPLPVGSDATLDWPRLLDGTSHVVAVAAQPAVPRPPPEVSAATESVLRPLAILRRACRRYNGAVLPALADEAARRGVPFAVVTAPGCGPEAAFAEACVGHENDDEGSQEDGGPPSAAALVLRAAAAAVEVPAAADHRLLLARGLIALAQGQTGVLPPQKGVDLNDRN